MWFPKGDVNSLTRLNWSSLLGSAASSTGLPKVRAPSRSRAGGLRTVAAASGRTRQAPRPGSRRGRPPSLSVWVEQPLVPDEINHGLRATEPGQQSGMRPTRLKVDRRVDESDTARM